MHDNPSCDYSGFTPQYKGLQALYDKYKGKDFVILGGGQAAMDVTRTSARQGKFEARFYHKIFEDEVGRVRGHFGPLNTVAVDPTGKSYASGGEDGYVRIHHFDRGYFDFKYEVERERENQTRL